MSIDASSQKLSTTVTVKKYDHEQEGPPQLIETVKVKDGVVIERIQESTEDA